MAIGKRMSKRVSNAVLRSLQGGVVPTVGLEHIAVGRERELEALTQDLDTIADGGASFRVLMGRYGSGKTFLGQMLCERALQRNFVVMRAELSQNARFTGSAGQGQMLYRTLLANVASKSRTGGNALPALLERWLSDIQTQVERDDGIGHQEPAFRPKMREYIHNKLNLLEGMVHGFDFAAVVLAYLDGHNNGDDTLKDAAIRWLRGEYERRREVQTALHFRAIIDDRNWYDYLKVFAGFAYQIGYRGLVVFIDELDHLYKLPNKTSRENNYERLLHIFNDTTQGNASHLGVVLGATDQVVEHERRGMFSSDALRTRLQPGRFGSNRLRDFSSPLIGLDPLGRDYVLTLLGNLQNIHGRHYNWEPGLDEAHRERFYTLLLNQPGAETMLTPREIVRDFVSVLNLLQQNPDRNLDEILHGEEFQPTAPYPDPLLDLAGTGNNGSSESPFTSFEL